MVLHGEIWNARKDVRAHLHTHDISMVLDGAGELCAILVFSDITRLGRGRVLSGILAFHDALTDLPNRNVMMD